jgi:diguanylate cyclase (GGDEF)-like protein
MDPDDHTPASRRGFLDRGAAPLIRNRPLIIALAFATVGVLAWLDRLTGTEVSMTALYLIPVAVVAWYIGRGWGRAVAIVAGAAQVAADLTAVSGAPQPAIIVWNAIMIVALSFVVGEVLTRLHAALDLQHQLARTDALTGVANSRSFHELAALELERSRRYGRPFTVACLDLDHFKSVNDALGHAIGDRLLHDIGHTLRAGLRRVDIVARLGGDEFTLLLPETSATAASTALEHVRASLGSLTEAYGPEVKASIGAVTFTEPPRSVGEMVRVADTAMYRAKVGGRDRVESLTLPQDAERLDEIELAALRAFAPDAHLPFLAAPVLADAAAGTATLPN